MCFIYPLLNYCIETGTAVTTRRADSVHIQFHCDHTTAETSNDLIGDIEVECRVVTVTEYQIDIHVMSLISYLFRYLKMIAVVKWIDASYAEGCKTTSYDIDLLIAMRVINILFKASVVMYCNRIVACNACVECCRIGKIRQVGITICSYNLTPVVMNDNLCEVNIHHRIQEHVYIFVRMTR